MIAEDSGYDLKISSNRIGELYPVLLDHYGNVIDGKHRLAADPNWPKVKLGRIKSKEQRLIARLTGNVCRREVSAREKKEMLRDLGSIYSQRGIGLERLSRKISEETGMSYSWVMKYLPNEYKMRPGLGGPVPMTNLSEGNEYLYKRQVAQGLTLQTDRFLLCDRDRVLSVKDYSNTRFVQIICRRHMMPPSRGMLKNLDHLGFYRLLIG